MRRGNEVAVWHRELGITEDGSATSRGFCRPHPEKRACASASAKSNARARVSKGPRRTLAKRSQAAAARKLSTVVENDRSFASPVSGLLFTGGAATL